ncbi:extracellular solute-binding protein [Paenibacillus sp. H1-7]|uniref:ABC transporter substrate-binding protein n=1 Tax=Paenibacillus sp. H1-7 TaxID=2282849 RepID=UPI001EF817AE|nr:extracellular solute-binding protein [Paenibacillus sp. H1-7]ULL16563.1 extracellular solute-binding protein [Paenibacillus sp. H1-7]
MKHTSLIAVLSVLILASSGCSGRVEPSGGSGGSVVADNEPVKLTMYQRGANISDEEFRVLIAEPVKKKYPYIDIELVHADKDKTPESLVSSGVMPDLVFTNALGVRTFNELNATEDLSTLIKANGFDLNRFEPNVIETIKSLGAQGQFYAVPFSINFTALFYNKDLFDKFAIPYPKDGMTWEEVIDLAKQLTRLDNGQQYYGLHPGGVELKSEQLSLVSFDPNTKKATLSGDGWVRIFQAHKAVTDIPGNQPPNNLAAFQIDQTLAMSAAKGARIGELEDLYNQGKALNWDLVSFPTFREAPRIDAEAATHMLMMTSTSNHKEAAFKVMEVVTEEANQSEMNKRGRLTSLKDPKIKENFGANLHSLKGKNVKGIFYNTPAVNRYNDKFTDLAKGQITTAINRVIKGEADINTALREAEELANKQIETELKKQ